ncbi:MAG: YgaP family membrane protein, partial [Methylocystis sp.]
MVANIGRTDRIIRIVAGLLLLSLVFIGPQSLWGLVGLIPLTTAFVNFCPA